MNNKNDSYIYTSPDGGKTMYRNTVGNDNKERIGNQSNEPIGNKKTALVMGAGGFILMKYINLQLIWEGLDIFLQVNMMLM